MATDHVSSTVDYETYYNVIDGQNRSSSTLTQAIDPSNKEKLWKVPVGSEDDLNDAVKAAEKAFPEWSRTKWSERQTLLLKAKDILLEQKDGLASMLLRETGKPIQFAQLEVEHASDFLTFYGKHAELEPQVMQDDDALKITVRYYPIGVVAGICPWNYPLVLAMGKIGAALLTGNCIIIKPSPYTPYSILKFTELVHHLFPTGVLQALNGDDTLGPLLCTNPAIQKISFTGSIATGKKIMVAAAPTLKDVTLELGGNSASIICPDVDVNVVAPQVALGSFFNSGQLCAASKRVYVHSDIYDDFLRVFVDTVRSWKVGPASIPGTMLGPVQNEMQYQIVQKFFQDSHKNNHDFVLGSYSSPSSSPSSSPTSSSPSPPSMSTTSHSSTSSSSLSSSSFVIPPAIISNPPDDSLLVRSEPFGPIVPILRWTDQTELLRRVNDTNTGLGGAVWSSDIPRAEAIASQIEAGTIWINSFEKPLPNSYFSGWKESGVGGGEWGTQGLYKYCRAKTVQFWKQSVGVGGKEKGLNKEVVDGVAV